MRRVLASVALLVIVGAGLLTANYLRPIPAVQASDDLAPVRAVPGSPPALPWPQTGGAAVAVSGLGRIGSFNADDVHPIASVTKMMTALLVLQDHPLQPGQPGPAVVISQADRQDFESKAAQGESVVEVQPGEQLTEYQLLEGLLIPSGNNLADLLARWDAGSVPSFITRMNSRAKALGMNRTHFDDTSGFSSQTVSSANDLLLLAPATMSIPVFAEIVAKPQAELPVAGTVYNVDATLGRDGIVGIKTGSSPPAGACFVFASTFSLGNRNVVVYGVVVYQHTLDEAFRATRSLIEAVRPALQLVHVLAAGQRVASYHVPWGRDIDAVAVQAVDLVTWPGLTIPVDTRIHDVRAPLPAGSTVGSVLVGRGTFAERVDVITSAPLYSPGRRWRLFRTDFL